MRGVCGKNVHLSTFLGSHTQKVHVTLPILFINVVSGNLVLTHGSLTRGTHTSEGDSLLWKVFGGKFSLKRQNIHVILKPLECTKTVISAWFVH